MILKKQSGTNVTCILSDQLTMTSHSVIPAKPLHNHAIVSVHFNNFYCTEICDKLRRDLVMFAYIYLNVDEC